MAHSFTHFSAYRMKKTSFIMSVLMAASLLPAAAGAQGTSLSPGQLVKSSSSSAVYYIDEDLSRHVFPNVHVFASWYANFDGVTQVDDATLSEYPLAGNVPYKPSKRLVKIQSDPKVYAVDEGGVLRWVKTEAVARALYGEHWNQMVDDLSDAFFVDYTVGSDVESQSQFDAHLSERIKNLIQTLRAKRLLKLEHRGASSDDLENDGFGKNKIAVCHKPGTAAQHTIFIASPALSAHLGHGDTSGRCAGDEDQGDTTAPTILTSSIGSVTATSAHVLFTSNESVTGSVYSSTASPVTASGTATAVSSTLATSHDVTLSGLASGTTYHVVIVVRDAAGNATTSSELTFTTLTVDTTAPTILSSSIGSVTTSSAHLVFAANEAVTAAVYVSATSPVSTSGTPAATANVLATSQDVTLSGLASGTTYHVVFIATDGSSNATASSELSFTTLTPDTTAPAILTSSIGSITATSAHVLFTTDEAVTAMIYSATATPVDTSGTATAQAATLATSQDVELTGLTSGTEYHVVIVAKDAALNATTSSELTFTTL